MQDPNERQVGGVHYRSKYQHWDLVIDTGMGYFEGQATRYICRYRKPYGGEGEKDLQKAIHYLDKLIATPTYQWRLNRKDLKANTASHISRFGVVNELTSKEMKIISLVAGWERLEDLIRARGLVLGLLATLVPLPEPNPVPLTEENHYSPRVGQGEE